jgi:cell division protein ZapA
MPQVTVTIAGRTYRMACGEGEEGHLERLAAHYDGKIQELRGSFGEIGDMRLHVMAALTLADEIAETRTKLDAVAGEVAALRAQAAAGEERAQAREAQLADALTEAAERIERLAKSFNMPSTVASQPEA